MDDFDQIRNICKVIRDVESSCEANQCIEEKQQQALDATDPDDIAQFMAVAYEDASETAASWQSLFSEIRSGDYRNPCPQLGTYIADHKEALGKSRRTHRNATELAESLRPKASEVDSSVDAQSKPSRVDLLLMVRELQRQAAVLDNSEELLQDKLRSMDGANAECAEKLKRASEEVSAALRASESHTCELEDRDARMSEDIRNDEETSHNALTEKGRARIDAEDKIQAAIEAVRKYEEQSRRESKSKLTVQQNEHFYPHAKERIRVAIDQCLSTSSKLGDIKRALVAEQCRNEERQKVARDAIEKTIDDARLVSFGKHMKVEHLAISVHAQLVHEGETSERKQAKCANALKAARVKCAEQESGIGKQDLMREIQYLRDEQENEKETQENLDHELREWESVFAAASGKKKRITDNVLGCPPQYDEENSKAKQWAKRMHTEEIDTIELSCQAVEDPLTTASSVDHALLFQRLAAMERQLKQKQRQSAIDETDSTFGHVNVNAPPEARLRTLEARVRCLELSGQNAESAIDETDSTFGHVNVNAPSEARLHTLEARVRSLELSGQNAELSGVFAPDYASHILTRSEGCVFNELLLGILRRLQ